VAAHRAAWCQRCPGTAGNQVVDPWAWPRAVASRLRGWIEVTRRPHCSTVRRSRRADVGGTAYTRSPNSLTAPWGPASRCSGAAGLARGHSRDRVALVHVAEPASAESRVGVACGGQGGGADHRLAVGVRRGERRAEGRLVLVVAPDQERQRRGHRSAHGCAEIRGWPHFGRGLRRVSPQSGADGDIGEQFQLVS